MGNARRPIVLDDTGQQEELQTADYLDIPESITYTAGENVLAGHICYIKSDGKAWKARANADSTAHADLVALENISADATGEFSIPGNDVPLPAAQTTTPGTTLFLSKDTAGLVDSAPVITSQNYLIEVGRALTASTQAFEPERRVKRF